MNLTNTVTAWIRTAAPMLAGWLISLPAARPILDSLGLGDTPAAAAAVAAILGAAWYGLARLAEHYWPAAGMLLGVPAKPSYGPIVRTVAGSLLNIPDTPDPLADTPDPNTPGASTPAVSVGTLTAQVNVAPTLPTDAAD